MFKVALTGGIASGKTSAAAEFRKLGVPVVDTDRIAREVVAKGEPGLAALLEAFGDGILASTGELDRQALRQRIFDDAGARRQVNAILHPMIRERLANELAHIDAPYVVIEIPLLTETGGPEDYQRVLVVDVPEEVQVDRLMERDGSSPAEAQAALRAQAPREQRLAIADDVINNSGNRTDLVEAVTALHARYLELSKRFASAPTRPSE